MYVDIQRAAELDRVRLEVVKLKKELMVAWEDEHWTKIAIFMYEDGVTRKEIAKEVGKSLSSVAEERAK